VGPGAGVEASPEHGVDSTEVVGAAGEYGGWVCTEYGGWDWMV
jgi:hypothetical protein